MSGLTLVELLVAVTLLAIMSLLAYRGLDGVVRSVEREREETQYWREIAMFMDRFRFDIEQPSQRPVRQGGELQPAWQVAAPDIYGEGGGIFFTRKSLNAEHNETRMGYRFSAGTIELLTWPTLDSAAATQPRRQMVLGNVRLFKLKFLAQSGQWQENWAGQEGLPRAVTLQLTMQSGIELTRIFALP